MLLARKTIVDGIRTDPKLALDYARNKRKHEFSTQQNTQQLDADGNPADATHKIEVVFVKADTDTGSV